MKQDELEKKAAELKSDITKRIETKPVHAVIVAFVGGFIAGLFKKIFIALIFLAIVAVVTAWFLAEKPGPKNPE